MTTLEEFLGTCRTALNKSISLGEDDRAATRDNTVLRVVLGNESADLDSAISALALAYTLSLKGPLHIPGT